MWSKTFYGLYPSSAIIRLYIEEMSSLGFYGDKLLILFQECRCVKTQLSNFNCE